MVFITSMEGFCLGHRVCLLFIIFGAAYSSAALFCEMVVITKQEQLEKGQRYSIDGMPPPP